MEHWYALHMSATAELVPLAVAAEELGYTGIALGDHLLLTARWSSAYPYSADGRVAMDPTAPFPDTWVALGAIAARTERLRMTTWVFVLPLRDPFTVARSVATLDVLSGGRFDFGIGVGWLEEEFAAAGIPFARRGARTDEMVAVLRDLWTGEPVSHHGEAFAYDDVIVRPAVDHPVPLYVGGHTDVALRRAARLDGWYALQLDRAALAERIGRYRELRAEVGSPGPGRVVAMADDAAGAADVEALAALGVDAVVFRPVDARLPLADKIARYAVTAARHALGR
jgi:probable F420-dependent oxidoreductase